MPIVLTGSTGSAKTGFTESTQFSNAVSYERGCCDCIASDFQSCKNPLNCVVLKKNMTISETYFKFMNLSKIFASSSGISISEYLTAYFLFWSFS